MVKIFYLSLSFSFLALLLGFKVWGSNITLILAAEVKSPAKKHEGPLTQCDGPRSRVVCSWILLSCPMDRHRQPAATGHFEAWCRQISSSWQWMRQAPACPRPFYRLISPTHSAPVRTVLTTMKRESKVFILLRVKYSMALFGHSLRIIGEDNDEFSLNKLDIVNESKLSSLLRVICISRWESLTRRMILPINKDYYKIIF